MTYAVAINGRPLPHIYTGFENREDAKRWCKRVGLDVAALDVWVVPVWSRDAVLPRHQKMTEELSKRQSAEPLPSPASKSRGRKQEPGPPVAGRRRKAA